MYKGIYNFFNFDYSAFHNAYITAANKKDAIQKLEEKTALEVGKILQVENGVTLNTKCSPKMQEVTDKLKNCLDGVIPATNFNNAEMTVRKNEGRAKHSGSTIYISAKEDIGTAIHETMHHLEEHSDHVLMNSLAFATSRTQGDKQESLKNSYTKEQGSDEYAILDTAYSKSYRNNKV